MKITNTDISSIMEIADNICRHDEILRLSGYSKNILKVTIASSFPRRTDTCLTKRINWELFPIDCKNNISKAMLALEYEDENLKKLKEVTLYLKLRR